MCRRGSGTTIPAGNTPASPPPPAEQGRDHLTAHAPNDDPPPRQAEKAARGERLFNSSAVAKDGETCASCHVTGGGVNPRLGVIVHRQDNPPPLNDFNGLREAPALWDVAHTAPYNWIGTARTLEAQAIDAVTTHFTNEAAAPPRRTWPTSSRS